MHPGRGQTTLRARGLGGHGARRDQHGVTDVLNLQDIRLPESRAEQTKSAGILTRRRMQHNEPHGRSLMIGFSTSQIVDERLPPCGPRNKIATQQGSALESLTGLTLM
ncbi:hypothetical protein GCM10010404_93900 [Nonomuraea africana]